MATGILELLAQKGLINRYQIEDIVDQAQEQFAGDIDPVLDALHIDEQQVLEAKSAFYGIPSKAIKVEDISFDVLRYIPEDAAYTYRFAPVGIENGTVLVGMTDPSRLEARNALQFIASKTTMPYTIVLVTYSDLKKVLDLYRGVGAGPSEIIPEGDDGELIDVTAEVDESQLSLEGGAQTALATNVQKDTLVEDAPVTKMVSVILKNAIEGGASDIHIENTGEKVKVRFRVDGTLYTSLLVPANLDSAIVARIKILAKLRLDEKRKPQDNRFYARIAGRKVDFRVSTLPTFYGEKVVIRILDPERGVKKLEDTGMSPEHITMVREALKRPYGLILLTGPTGSGKTTTLYSMLQEVDRESLNVVSLEDPIEYNIVGMNQSQVRPEIGYTFATGLRSILRQDPDVITVGEIRDKETAQLAVQAALTGHLVFATLHTNNAIGVIPRLVDMGVDPYLIAPTLVLAVAQRLTKRICDGAQQEVPVEDSMKVIIDREFADLPEQVKSKLSIGKNVHQAVPTAACPSGVKGRVAVFEMFTVDKDIEHAILTNPTEPEIYAIARKNGMLTMKEDAILKSIEGIIPFSEVNTL